MYVYVSIVCVCLYMYVYVSICMYVFRCTYWTYMFVYVCISQRNKFRYMQILVCTYNTYTYVHTYRIWTMCKYTYLIVFLVEYVTHFEIRTKYVHIRTTWFIDGVPVMNPIIHLANLLGSTGIHVCPTNICWTAKVFCSLYYVRKG
jgi:hypothetical protein